MTARKHFKQLVRARMQKTGESYVTARRQVLRQAAPPPSDPAARWHFPGSVPVATALRVVLASAGVRAPHTGEPFSEAMLFGLAGGLGIGVFSFLYEKENVVSFYVAGRHGWQDDVAWFKDACKRLGVEPTIKESGGAKTAEKQLREILAEHGSCVAWVDAAHLPHRALPTMWSGGGYHVITVYRINDEDALIGDLTDEPIALPLPDLAKARERIKKQKNRLLAVPTGAASPKELAPLVRDGLRACHRGLVKQRMQNFTLEAIRVWAERMHGSKDKESWERVFTPGGRLWRGLVSVYDFIEHYGTGGGLCRPLFADFLAEAADALKDGKLRALSERYAELGRAWSELAHAALPDDVPLLRQTRELHARKAELTTACSPAVEVRAVWERIDELEKQAREQFPLSDVECADLRAALQSHLRALYESEVAAHTALGEVIG
jgi:hypothetical protein